MTFTYLLNTQTGLMRLRLSDTDPQNPIFIDEELEAFYTLEGSNLKKACALALETIADNEVLVLKVIKLMQLSTDGAKVADSLRKSAKLLRDQAATEIEDSITSDAFDIAEWINGDFSSREYIYNIYDRLA